MKEHGREINIVLCGAPGDLALQSTKTETFLLPEKSPTMLLRAMETIKPTIQLVFLLGFRVASIGTYFNMLLFTRLETKRKSCILLACFNISMALTALLKMGASIQVCPLFLSNAGKTTDDLIKGITVAKPSVIAGRLLDKEYQNLTF